MEWIGAVNFNALDLNLLRVFDALMRERSATRAGDRVGLSQPAVSSALNRLRGHLDDQLFVRRGHEMVPTPRAEDLAGPIRRALDEIERAVQGGRVFDAARAVRTCTLLGADFFSVLLMPELYREIATQAPGVSLRFLDSARGDVHRLLQDDAIDAALERPLEMPDFVSSELLFRSPFVVMAARGHPAIAAAGLRPGDAVPLDLFCSLPHAIRSIDGSMRGMVDEAIEKAGHRRRVVLALPHFQGIAFAVASSEVIAAVPRQFADVVGRQLPLDAFSPPIGIPVPDIRLYWHARHDADPTHVWLRGAVLATVRRLWPEPAG